MKVVVITGQTATGKTKLALQYKGTVLNSDSRQIYKKLDIITGKEHKEKILLYDVIDPKKYFSSFDYQKIALPLIKKILSKGKTPILVGGTYLYLSHLLYEVDTENIPPNWKLRKELNGKTVLELQKRLNQLSVQSFNQLNDSDKNNPQRLIRKIEITQSGFLQRTATAKNEFALEKKLNMTEIKIDFIGLRFEKKENLTKNIKARVKQRFEKGAVEEVRSLLDKGYRESDPGLKTIGYKQIIQYLKKELTKDEMIDQWVIKELQYAKRQYTFMKKDPNIKWFFV